MLAKIWETPEKDIDPAREDHPQRGETNGIVFFNRGKADVHENML